MSSPMIINKKRIENFFMHTVGIKFLGILRSGIVKEYSFLKKDY